MDNNTQTITPTKAIMEFFAKDGGREVKMDELRRLSSEEREQLGQLCAKALGKELAAA